MRNSARFLAAVVFFASVIPGQALAANNAVVVTPGTGITMRSQDIGGGVQSMVEIPGDTSGNPLATAPGTGNSSFALPVQGVSGGVAMPISAASLPLPTGAATAAGLTTINGTLGSPFQAGGSVGNTGFNALQGGSANAVGNPFYVSPGTGAQFTVVGTGTLATQVTSSALPTGAGTSANQSTIITDLGNINTTLGTPMQNSGGSVTANAGTNLNTSALALHSDLATNGLTTSHTCSTGGFSVGGCLGQIDDDVKGAISFGGNSIGFVGVYGATYNTIAASQTKQALTGGSGGATGDYLSHCVITPTTTSPGEVELYDSSGGSAIVLFEGGSSSVTSLAPIPVPWGAKSTAGAWELTTGANETVACFGKFT